MLEDHWGLKKWTSIPCVTIVHIAPKTSRMLKTIPKLPSDQLRYHIALCFTGLLVIIHIIQGYAKVTGSVMPPISPAKLGKKGRATAIKNARHPKNIRNAALNHHGHGLLLLLVDLNSRLSKTGIAYIWNDVKLLRTINRLVAPGITFDVSFLWYLSKALIIPPLEGIWRQSTPESVLISFKNCSFRWQIYAGGHN